MVLEREIANANESVVVPDVTTLPDTPQDTSANAMPMSSIQVEADAMMRTKCLTDMVLDGGGNAVDGQELRKIRKGRKIRKTICNLNMSLFIFLNKVNKI